MKVKISPLTKKLNVAVNIPSSKSLSIRALLLASISQGKSIIENVLSSDDTNSCIDALKELGIELKQNDNTIEIVGCNGVFPIKKKETKVFVGSSGITSRFLLGLIVASLEKIEENISIILDGSGQLRTRPIKPLVDSLLKIGANIEYMENDGCLPLRITPAKLEAKYIEVSGKLSSQYVSSVLMLSPMLKNEVNIRVLDIDSENHPYIQMALQTMKDFGIEYTENENNLYTISPQKYKAKNFVVETDFNSANYFFALAAANCGIVKVKSLNKETQQPGILFLNLLEKMGCKIDYKENSIAVTGSEKLKGGLNVDMFLMAEMVMTLAILAVFADTPIKIYGVSHIRSHESDRINAICSELQKAGIKCEEFEDGLVIYPGNPKNVSVDSHGDHRIAMSLAIMGIAGNGITIENAEVVSKNFPEFFDLLNNIGVTIKYE